MMAYWLRFAEIPEGSKFSWVIGEDKLTNTATIAGDKVSKAGGDPAQGAMVILAL